MRDIYVGFCMYNFSGKNYKLCSSINVYQRGKYHYTTVWLHANKPRSLGHNPPGNVSSEIKVRLYVVIINGAIIWDGRSITSRLDGQCPSSFTLVSLTY